MRPGIEHPRIRHPFKKIDDAPQRYTGHQFQVFSRRQSDKTNEHMRFYGVFLAMEDRPGNKVALCHTEGLLNAPKIPVVDDDSAVRRIRQRDIGVIPLDAQQFFCFIN